MNSKVLVFCIFLFSSLIGTSQTREETEAWIWQKLEKHVKVNFCFDYSEEDNKCKERLNANKYGSTKVNFSEHQFGSNYGMELNIGNFLYFIPFEKVKSIRLLQKESNETVVLVMDDERAIENTWNLFFPAVEFDVNLKSEENLPERFYEALSHYKELCQGKSRKNYSDDNVKQVF